MTRLKLIINVFFIALSIPLAYFVVLAYRGVQQEEKAELQYFTKILFDEIEDDLMSLIFREETRAVDEYSYYLATDTVGAETGPLRSPLSYAPKEPYILGYLQNNPDGSLQAPLVENDTAIPSEVQHVTDQLALVNTFLNTQMLATVSETSDEQPTDIMTRSQQDDASQEDTSSFTQKYLDLSQLQEQSSRTITNARSIQRITKEQVFNIAQNDPSIARDKNLSIDFLQNEHVHVKVTPMQSRIINEEQILIFRRIVINSQVYRQGFVIFAKEFLKYVQDTYFTGQPITDFTQLHLKIRDGEETRYDLQTGSRPKKPVAIFNRIFPRPFSFLQITLICRRLPPSDGRWILNVMRALTSALILAGLLVMYQSARTVMELSERRAQFVSSVTHELKTPLTNIQMYSEMLEQGVAPNRDREREYFHIIGTESRRLSRLIDHVLEFSKLSRKQRRFRLQKGFFDDVISDIQDIFQEQLQQENFALFVEKDANLCFEYDREVMVQILVNLIENSIKFGKAAPTKEIRLSVQRENTYVCIQVADTGPGIPPAALKNVFTAFYRADTIKNQAIRGTGLGLSLVKKYVDALGGTVAAGNNNTSGCTITIRLPI